MYTIRGNVTTGSLTVGNAKVVISGTAVCTLSIKYLYITASGRFDSFSNVGITTTGYIDNQPINGSKASIALNRGDAYISGPITLTGNTDVGIATIAVSRIFFSTASGGVFNVGLFVANGSVIYIGTSNSLSATTPLQQSSGGMIINPNGTQISSLTSSGLTCAWGTIQGGYRRIGIASGYAQIIVNIRITITQAMTAGTVYTINGLPIITDGVPIACTVDDAYRTKTCYISNNISNSFIYFIPSTNTSVGWTQNFSATYITNS